MNKTYKANENINDLAREYMRHASQTQDVETDSLTGFLGWLEINQCEETTGSEWVDDVIGACKKLREAEEPTVSDDDMEQVLLQIATDGTKLSLYHLATYLAKLEKLKPPLP